MLASTDRRAGQRLASLDGVSEQPEPRGGPEPEPEPPVLPSRGADDTDQGWGERPEDDDPDERLRREVPPHW